jgi:hypothetical protein
VRSPASLHTSRSGVSLAANANAAAAADEAAAIDAAAKAAGLASSPLSLLLRETAATPRGRADAARQPAARVASFSSIPDTVMLAAEASLAAFAGGGATTAAADLLVPLQVQLSVSQTGQQAQALSLGCGDLHMCVATSGGEAFSWGWGGSGALGHGDTLDRTVPTRISALPRDVVQVACGAAHTLVLVDKPMPPQQHLQAPPPLPLAQPAVAGGALGTFGTTGAASTAASAAAATLTSSGAITAAPRGMLERGEREASVSFSAGSFPTPTNADDAAAKAGGSTVRELYAFGSCAFGQVPLGVRPPEFAPASRTGPSSSSAASAPAQAPALATSCVLPRLVELPFAKSDAMGARSRGAAVAGGGTSAGGGTHSSSGGSSGAGGSVGVGVVVVVGGGKGHDRARAQCFGEQHGVAVSA